ncbi:MAG: type II secretion system protein GspG [Luminiphilus sp.]
MSRLTATLLIAPLLGLLVACTSNEEKASKVLDESLRSPSSSYKDMASYPGNVTCGKYLDLDYQGFPVYKEFVVVDTEANLRPSKLDVAVYCSDDPVAALNKALDIDYQTQREQIAAVLDDFRLLSQPLLDYERDNRHFPWTEQGLQALVEPTPHGNPPRNFPEGGYVQTIPKDPWGNNYDYVCPPFAGVRILYSLQSLGADGVAGGSGPDADIKHDYIPYFEHLEAL